MEQTVIKTQEIKIKFNVLENGEQRTEIMISDNITLSEAMGMIEFAKLRFRITAIDQIQISKRPEIEVLSGENHS